jgi:hypothetical protein
MSLLSLQLIESSPALSSLSASKRSARAGKGSTLKRLAVGAAAFVVAAFGYVAITGHEASAQQGLQAQQGQQNDKKGNPGPPANAQQTNLSHREEHVDLRPIVGFTYKATFSDVSGVAPDFPELDEQVFEINISATCAFATSDHHTITVSLHDLRNNVGRYVVTSSVDGQPSVSILTGPVVGFESGGAPAFDVVCDTTATEIEIIAFGQTTR